MADRTLNIKYAADTSRVKDSLKDMDDAHGKFGAKVSATGKGVAGELKGMVGAFSGSFGQMGGILGGMGGKLSGLGAASAAGFGTMAVAAAAAAVGIVVAMKKAADTFVAYAGEVRKVAAISGATAEDASKLTFVFKHMGMDVDGAGRAMGIFSKNLQSGAPALTKWFTQAELADLKSKDLAQGIPLLAKKFQELESPIEKNAFLMNVFGRFGLDMRRILTLTAGDLAAVTKEAERLGLVMSDKDLKSAKEYKLAMQDLDLAFQSLTISVGKNVAPALTKVADFTVTAIEKTTEFNKQVDIGRVTMGIATMGISELARGLFNVGTDLKNAATGTKELSEAEREAIRATADLNKEIETAAPKALEAWAKAGAEFDKRLDAFVPKFGDTFKAASDVSVAHLSAGMAENNRTLEGWLAGVTKLAPRIQQVADRDIAQAFLARIAEMGPGSAALLAELNTLSDAKLKETVNIFGTNIGLAKQAADLQFDKYPANWSQKIQAANTAVFGKLGDLVSEFNAVPNKTGPMAAGLAAQINQTIAEILAMQRTGAVALTPLQEQLLITASKMSQPEDKARAIKRALQDIPGNYNAHVNVRGDWSWNGGRPWGNGPHMWHQGGAVMHGGGLVKMHGGGFRADERLALLQRGEFVIRRKAVDAVGTDALEQLNSGRAGPQGPAGGPASRAAAGIAPGAAGGGPLIGTVINKIDAQDPGEAARKVTQEMGWMLAGVARGRR